MSGGIDSAAALRFAQTKGLDVHALHVSYGQAAADAELAAAGVLTTEAGVQLKRVTYRGRAVGPGEIRGRNALLAQIGLFEFPAETGLLLLGIHAGTGYCDCTPQFVEAMQKVYALHTGGRIEFEAPFVNLLKAEVIRLAHDLEVPIESTHSCEAGNVPCGRCQSCLDRTYVLSELSRADS